MMKNKKKCYNSTMRKHQTYTIKEKVAVYRHYQKHGWAATAKKYAVPYPTFVFWKQKVKQGKGSLAQSLARKPKRHTVREETVALVKKLHKLHPELSLEVIRKQASQTQRISRTTVWHIVTGR